MNSPIKQSALRTSNKHISNILFGTFLILLAFLLVFSPFNTETAEYLEKIASRLGLPGLAAFNAYYNFSSLVSFFVLPSSLLAIYTGILIIKNRTDIKIPLILSAVSNILSITAVLLINIISVAAPQIIAQSIKDRNFTELIRSEVFIAKLPSSLYSLLISTGILVLTIILISRCKHSPCARFSSWGSILMFFSISVLYTFGDAFSAPLISQFGTYIVLSSSIVNSFFPEQIFLILLLSTVIISILFSHIKKIYIAFSEAGGIFFVGLLCLLFCNIPTELMNHEDILPSTPLLLKDYIIVATVFIIAISVWINFCESNLIPTWLQITLPIIIPVLYFLFKQIAFYSALPVFWKLMRLEIAVISLFIIVMSLLIRKKNAPLQ